MTTTHDVIWYDDMPTPIGSLRLAADVHGLREVWFEDDKYRTKLPQQWIRDSTKVDFAREQLEEYFEGERQTFDLPLHPLGTPFQCNVWNALVQIPYGTTVSYSDIAHRIGQPQAVRAVGAANGRNPIPIIVPCHRVIGANGSLTGFGGGLPIKRFLLAMEDRVARGDLFTHTAESS